MKILKKKNYTLIAKGERLGAFLFLGNWYKTTVSGGTTSGNIGFLKMFRKMNESEI